MSEETTFLNIRNRQGIVTPWRRGAMGVLGEMGKCILGYMLNLSALAEGLWKCGEKAQKQDKSCKQKISRILFFILLLVFYLVPHSNSNVVAIHSVDTPTTMDSRIKTIVYNPNEVIELTFHYGFQSFIELNDDEEISVISLGEAYPWKITEVGKRIFIRPTQINANTNMTIITSKRIYMFQIRSDSYEGKGDEELIYSVRFFYPDQKIKIPNSSGLDYASTTNLGDKSKEELDNVLNNFKRGTVLNFDYSMTTKGNKVIKLLKAFDDGINTYLEFEDRTTIPAIYVVDLNGREANVKYIFDGPYVVISGVHMQFSLRVTDNIVCVFNNSLLY